MATSQYRDPRWSAFRQDAILLANNECSQCGKHQSEKVVLQVHHIEYLKGKHVWDTPHDRCKVLCRGCHAKEHGIIQPSSSFELIGEDDLGDISGNCDCCGTGIRFVFFIFHKKWGTIGVGTDCCDRLTETNIATESRKRAEKRKRFVSSRRWTIHSNGNEKIIQDSFRVLVFKKGQQYMLKIGEKRGSVEFPSIVAAKARAFDCIEQKLSRRKSSVDDEEA